MDQNLEEEASLTLGTIHKPARAGGARERNELMYIGIGTIVVIVIIVLVILMLRRLCPRARLIPICRMNLTRRYQEAAGGKPMGAET